MAGAIEGAAATVIASARQPSACEPIEHAAEAGVIASSRTSTRIRAALRRCGIRTSRPRSMTASRLLPGDYPVKHLPRPLFVTFHPRCYGAVIYHQQHPSHCFLGCPLLPGEGGMFVT